MTGAYLNVLQGGIGMRGEVLVCCKRAYVNRDI
jgi:hypothetical protein